MEGQTEGRNAENYVPPLFFEKAGDNKSQRVPLFFTFNPLANYCSYAGLVCVLPGLRPLDRLSCVKAQIIICTSYMY